MNQGLTAFFETGSIDIMGLHITPKIFIVVLLVMNMVGYIKAHFSGMVVGYASNYNSFSKFLLLLSIFCCSIVQIWSKILYFSPALGLFDLLHHYQGKYVYSYILIHLDKESS